jgi:hypothetical protein
MRNISVQRIYATAFLTNAFQANVYYLRSKGMTNLTVDYLMWHNFGRNLDECSPDLIQSYQQYFSKIQHPKNLAGFIESYAKYAIVPALP